MQSLNSNIGVASIDAVPSRSTKAHGSNEVVSAERVVIVQVVPSYKGDVPSYKGSKAASEGSPEDAMQNIPRNPKFMARKRLDRRSATVLS